MADYAGSLSNDCTDTYMSKHVSLSNPDPDTICIEDIAHHLSLICRFVGACKFHYSVGQHSLLVCKLVGERGGDRLTQLGALLHDASEAYTGDFHRPLKYMDGMKVLRDIDSKFQDIINKKFGIENIDWALVKKVDDIAVSTEAYKLLLSGGKLWSGLPAPLEDIKIRETPPEHVERSFLFEYRFLS